MKEKTFVYRSSLAHPAERVFAWHARPGALERLIPPWSRVRVVSRHGGIEPGSTVELRMPVGPFTTSWLAEHTGWIEGHEFTDVQRRGPFAKWIHTHRTTQVGERESLLEDVIEYQLPGGAVGRTLANRFVRAELSRTFAYRHRVTGADLDAHVGCDDGPVTVAVSGASGLVGSTLVPFLRTGGHRVFELGRSQAVTGPDRLVWDPAAGAWDTTALEGVGAVVHLAGENIASRRWSRERKQRILESRTRASGFLARKLAAMRKPPKVLVSASAIGFYGDRGERLVTETDDPGEGFLSEVCRQWEAALDPARAAGMRVVCLRIGVVLSAKGGALARMLTPFSFGAGGVLGRGDQFMSWIGLEDLVRLIHHVVLDGQLDGPVNAVAPNPVTNREFTTTLARVLKRPAVVPVPAFALRAAVGEMADALLLASTRVGSDRLAGFAFQDPNLESALRSTLGRTESR